MRVGRILESDVWPTAKAMRVPCSANKCRIRESDLQAACLYIIFLNGYETVFRRPGTFVKPDICRTCAGAPDIRLYKGLDLVYGIKQLAVYRFIVWRLLSGY